MALGKAVINISANLAPLRRGLISAKAAVVSSMATIGRSVTSMARNLARGAFRIISRGLRKMISLAKIAAVAILGIGIASVKISVDAEETENLFVESMGSMANATRSWAKEYSKARGLFENDTKKMVATLFLMLSSMGLSNDEALKMAKSITALTGDMASFRNIRIEEAFLKLQAGITGEAEPLKRLGILITENFLKTTKLGKALKKTGGEYTEIQKIQLRYAAIMQQTTKDQGDLLRTINSTANVLRTIGGLLKTTAKTIGDVFKPAVTDIAIVMRDWLSGSQDQIKEWSKTILEKIKMVIGLFKDLATVIGGPEKAKTKRNTIVESISELEKQLVSKKTSAGAKELTKTIKDLDDVLFPVVKRKLDVDELLGSLAGRQKLAEIQQLRKSLAGIQELGRRTNVRSTIGVEGPTKEQIEELRKTLGGVQKLAKFDAIRLSVLGPTEEQKKEILKTIEELRGKLKSVAGFSEAKQNLHDAFKGAFDLASSAVRSIYDWVAQALKNLKPIAASIGEEIGGAIITGLRKAAQNINIPEGGKKGLGAAGTVAKGAAIGAALGSVIPGAGTLAGAGAGAVAGALKVIADELGEIKAILTDMPDKQKRTFTETDAFGEVGGFGAFF